jgi:hypothetical protein
MGLKLSSSSWRNGQIKKQKARRPLFKFWIPKFLRDSVATAGLQTSIAAGGWFVYSLALEPSWQ